MQGIELVEDDALAQWYKNKYHIDNVVLYHDVKGDKHYGNHKPNDD